MVFLMPRQNPGISQGQPGVTTALPLRCLCAASALPLCFDATRLTKGGVAVDSGLVARATSVQPTADFRTGSTQPPGMSSNMLTQGMNNILMLCPSLALDLNINQV